MSGDKARIIDGRRIAESIHESVAERARALRQRGHVPHLVAMAVIVNMTIYDSSSIKQGSNTHRTPRASKPHTHSAQRLQRTMELF